MPLKQTNKQTNKQKHPHTLFQNSKMDLIFTHSPIHDSLHQGVSQQHLLFPGYYFRSY